MDTRTTKTLVLAGGTVVGALILAAFVAMALQMQAASAQQRAALQLVAAQQTAAAQQTVSAQQQATATAHAAAQATQQAAAQATVVANQTATAIAHQNEIAMRAAAQETVTAAQAQDTAVAVRKAQAQAVATANAQETAVAVGQQVADAQVAVAQATASAPQNIMLGTWNNVCVVQNESNPETITFASDDTWAQDRCAWDLEPPTDDVPFPSNAPRPGSIQCAFIQDDAGLWSQFFDYGAPHSGTAQIAVRAPYWSEAAADCTYYQGWIQQQNAGN
jgi:hypothetical protein